MHFPKYHFRPAANWMNDPNGLCQVNGWYHMFCQYNPHGSQWGDMHWAHARSRDLVRWEEMPIAMAPRLDKGEIHCFSGGCCKDETGKPHFFYTSIGREKDGRDCADGAQQWLAEPVDDDLTQLVQSDAWALTDAVHGGMHVREWRDPCVLRRQGQYLMVLGGCLEGRGCVLLYTSPDMKRWSYRHVLAQSAVADGKPWECPNFFELDGKFVLFYSPCSQVMVQVGTLDEQLHFHCEHEEVLDPGGWQGYYAPQAFRDESGRMILFAWMPECDGGRDKGWSGVMSLPRVLRLKNGHLDAQPAEEIASLAEWTDLQVQPGETCLTQDGRRLLVRLQCNVKEELRMRLFASESGGTMLTLSPQGVLTLAPERSRNAPDANCEPIIRQVRLPRERAEIFLALDGSTVEVMVNGQWLSARVYPDGTGAGVYLQTAEKVTVQVGRI